MRWELLAAQGDTPKARSSHSITAVGDGLYVWGGEHAPRVPLGDEMYRYSLTDRTWQLLEVSGTPPLLRNAHAAAAIGTDIYIFGGRSGIDIGEGSLNDLHRFDTLTNTWAAVTPAAGSELPPKRSYHAAAAAGGRLYVFGGCGEGSMGRLNDLWEFNPDSASWRQLPSSEAIKGRGGAGFAATPGALFVVAGFSGKEMDDVHRFDLATETWDCPRCCGGADAQPGDAAAAGAAGGGSSSCGHEPVALPARSVCAVAAHGCSSCAHSNHVVVFGGEVDPSTQGHAGAGQFSNDTYCLDTACRHWHRVDAGSDLPCPRGWLAATACAEGVVIHGGNSNSNDRLADMYLLRMHA